MGGSFPRVAGKFWVFPRFYTKFAGASSWPELVTGILAGQNEETGGGAVTIDSRGPTPYPQPRFVHYKRIQHVECRSQRPRCPFE